MPDQSMSFDEILDTIERLSIEQQETLLDVLHRRLIELRRGEIARNAAEAKALYRTGKLPTGSVDDMLADFSSNEEVE